MKNKKVKKNKIASNLGTYDNTLNRQISGIEKNISGLHRIKSNKSSIGLLKPLKKDKKKKIHKKGSKSSHHMSKSSLMKSGLGGLMLNNESRVQLHDEENKDIDDEIAELEKLRSKNKELLKNAGDRKSPKVVKDKVTDIVSKDGD